jgi:hypothetical protein
LVATRAGADANEIERLRLALRVIYSVDSSYVGSEVVREAYGAASWEGLVQIFAVHGHTRAKIAYTWGQTSPAGNREYTAVLGVPPIASARDAVRKSLAAEIHRRDAV